MPNMTFALPEDLRREMRRRKEVRWAEVARRAIARELDRLNLYDRVLSNSELAETDAVDLGRAIRRRSSLQRR